MVDFKKSTGSSGEMMIRDTGTTVEFWLRAGSSTFSYDLPWRFYVNGAWSTWREFRFESGGAWQRLGIATITTSQTVSFSIGDSGTNGLGGPTTISAAIDRVTVPPAPKLNITSWTDTTIGLNLDSNGSGGSTVLQWQVGYGTSSSAPSLYKDLPLSNGVGSLTGLVKGTRYYLWARGRNVEGWGPWSSRQTVLTWDVPVAPSAVVISDIRQSAVKTKFTLNGNGGTAITSSELGYGTNPLAPTTIVLNSGALSEISDLIPGEKTYFWARSRNAVGYSAWSVVSSATLLAGARILVDNVWRNAVPYVKVGGEWKVASVYVKIAGLWKGTG